MARGQWTQGSGGGLDTSEVTATADKVLKGYTAGVKDSDEPQEGTLEVQSIVNFSVAQRTYLGLTCTWALPDRGPYSGVMIRYKAGEYPTNIEDGELAYEGPETYCTISGLIADTYYYFCAWSYMTTNYGRFYAREATKAQAAVDQSAGEQIYTSSEILTIPDGIHTIDVFCVGGGAGSCAVETYSDSSGGSPSGGGGGGYTKTMRNISVIPGEVLSVTVGNGGGRGDLYQFSDLPGGTSSVAYNNAVICSATGGHLAYSSNKSNGGDGGSGGGSGGAYNALGGKGGSDGGNGAGYKKLKGGAGQGSTTRAFGESAGTLYSGGGGGGGNVSGGGVTGGAGGGGNGGSPYSGANGTFGTGGGGGGGYPISSNVEYAGALGGSGCVIVRYTG